MSLPRNTKIQHPDDVREALGFRGEPAGFDLLALYRRAEQSSGDFSRGDLRVAFQIADDPYYWPTFKRYQSMPTLVNAGFFDDGLEPGTLREATDLHYLSTPLEHIRRRVTELEEEGRIHEKPLSVVVTTGCFAPMTDGHVWMLERGKQALEEKGHAVLGGFFSPSHDDYVATKSEAARQLTADYRINAIHRAIEGSDWMALDPWEARVAPTDINFTQVVARLEHYINAHIDCPVPIEVAYVCGGDNMQFTRAFTENGRAVCVARPGTEDKFDELVEKSGLKDNPRIAFAKGEGINISSTMVRAGKAPAIARLKDDRTFSDLIKGEARVGTLDYSAKPAAYLVRDDLSWATEPWSGKADSATLGAAATTFRNGLVRAIENAFERSRAPGYPRQVDVVLLSVEDQMREAEEIMALRPDRIVNNDIVTAGPNMSIGLSRLFDLSSGQVKSGKLVPRAGKKDLARMMGRLQKGDYTIVDDDIATGSTIRMIEEKLPEGVRFTEKVALSERAFNKAHPDKPYAFWDIVDARDFLMGARAGGLVVHLFNGETGRAPYLLPYTSLTNRAKIPPDQERAFTAEVLKLNKRFFRDIWADVRLKDTDPQFQSTMKTAGFRKETHMDDVCGWHMKFAK